MNITEAQNQFNSAARWNLCGSLIYVILKLSYHATLFYLLDPTTYGSMGYIFSYIFLLVNMASAPTLYSLSTFFNEYSISRRKTNLILGLLMSVQLVLLVISAVFLWTQLMPKFPSVAPYASVLVIMEGIRLSLRLFMHLLQRTKFVLVLELTSMAGYMGLVAGLSYYFDTITLPFIFVPFALDSLIVLSAFVSVMVGWLRSLPAGQVGHSATLLRRIFTTASVNGFSYLTHSFLSGNALIVAYAPTLGFSGIAVPKFAAYTADALRMLVKSLVGYSGLPLLSRLKGESPDLKRSAFRDISQRLFLILIPATLIIAFQVSKVSSALYLLGMFFCLKVVDQLFYLYEKFYMLEEKAGPIMLVCAAEFILFLGVILYSLSLTVALTCLVAIRLISLCGIMLNAWFTLGIRPSLTLTWQQGFLITGLLVGSELLTRLFY
jgi:hypothetical protein